MTTSGKSVHTTILEKIGEVERMQNEQNQYLSHCENTIAASMQERELSLGKLATIYLPEMTASAIQQTLREVQRDVQNIFREKQETRKRLEDLMVARSQKTVQLQERLGEVDGQLEHIAAERDTAQSAIAKDLAADDTYKTLQPQAQQTHERLMQNKKRHEVFKDDAEKKLVAYAENPVFQYLLTRKYGTPDYSGTFLTRDLDKWVARLISYNIAKYNYDFLLSMPGAIEAEIAQRQEEFASLQGEMHVIEEKAAQKHGLPKILEAGKKLGAERSLIMQSIEQCNADYHKYAKERETLHNTKGEYHHRALQTLKDFLNSNTLAELKRRAHATANPEDDKLVTRVEELDEEIKREKNKAKTHQKELHGLAEKLSELKSLENTYTQKDFESSRSYFTSGFDIASMLSRLMAGNISSHEAFQEIDKYQKFKPRETYRSSSSSSIGTLSSGWGSSSSSWGSSSSSSWGSSSGSSSSSSSSSWSSGGGFFSGGSSSGGGFGGGGFSTGGGF